MNKYIYTLPLLAATLTLSSCFKEEPLNSECDITHVSLHTDNPLATFYQLSDTAKDVLSTDSLISFEVRREHEADLSLLTPTLRLLAPQLHGGGKADDTYDQRHGEVRL